MIFSRKIENQDKDPSYLPDAWRNEVESLLHEIYADQEALDGRTFEVFGLTYPDELLLLVSLAHPLGSDQAGSAAVSFQVSADLNESEKPDKLLKTLVDSFGLFFDHYFQNIAHQDNEDFFRPRWEEQTSQGKTFYYRISRENISLALQAEALLKKEASET